MNIFGWRKQDVKNLKAIIEQNENLITELHDEKIYAQISESRVQSGFNAQLEADRANHEVIVAQYQRKLEVLEASKHGAIDTEVKKLQAQYNKDLETAKAEFRKSLRAEFTESDSSNKATIKKLTEENAKNSGLYNGALLVIKSLETQLATTNKLNDTLVRQLPEIKANFTTAQAPQSVIVNGK